MADRLVLAAPAKVNLYLAVGGRRGDGFHDVLTILQALDLHDTIVLEPADVLMVIAEPDLGVAGEANLAAVAARALAARIGREARVSIRISKRIPAAGGLGGGSADAAATLAGLAEWWGMERSDARVCEAARDVGADVAFFLEGGCALFGGRGDELVRRLRTPQAQLVLVNPGVSVATAAAYAAFDRTPQAAPPGPGAMIAAVEAGVPRQVAEALYDNLTEPVTGMAPDVADALAWVESAPGVLGACLAGSGGTVFGVCACREDAEAAAAAAGERGWWARATATRSRGVVLIEGEGVE